MRARKGTKEFFQSQVQYLMENDDAFERYKAAIQSGVNPIDPNPSVAPPASPERSVESQTAAPQQIQESSEEQISDDLVEPADEDQY